MIRVVNLGSGAQPKPQWVAALALLAAFNVQAQGAENSDTQAESEPQALAPITVTGDKLGRSVSESAASVGLATEEDLESSTDAKAQEVVSKYGNVLRVGSDREIAIRGIPQNGIAGEGETISVYLDGVALTQRAASFGGPLSTFDLERVEVLRGPQSTAQGRNSLAGAVILRGKRPTSDWDGRARITTTDPDGHQYAVAGGGPIIEDQLLFRLSLEDRYAQGDIKNVTTGDDDAGREDTQTGRLSFTVKPDVLPDYRADFSATLGNNEFGDTLHDVEFGERTESSNVRYSEDYDSQVYSFEQFLLLGDYFDLTAITGYVDGDGFRTVDFDRTEEEAGFSTFDLNEQRVSQELRLAYTNRAVRGVVGLYYEDSERGLRNDGEGIPIGGGIAAFGGFVNTENDTRTLAAFTEVDWDFLERWKLTLGLRVNREQAERQAQSEVDLALLVPLDALPFDLPLPDGLTPPIPLPDAISDALAVQGIAPPDYDVDEDDDSTVVLPKVGLTWQYLANHSAALTYQEGFRSGGISVSFFGGAVSEFDPEFTDTVELAFRSSWLSDRLEGNFNLFYTDWEDQQVLIGDSTGFSTLTTNAGSSHLFGGEAELLWRVNQHWETFASLGLLETEFDEFTNEDQDFAGNEFPFAPDYTATVGLALLPWNNWEGQISVQRTDAYFSGPENTDDRLVSGRTLLNARIGYAVLPSLKLLAFGRNLTDDDNIQGQFASDGRLARRYGEPRTVGVGVEWQP